MKYFLADETGSVKLGGWGRGSAVKGAGEVVGKGWRVGDPIDALTKAGKEPSWSTVRFRYWKNRANSAFEGEFSPENLQRMSKGKAPLHDELGVSKELHHVSGRNIENANNISNLQELWPWQHELVDPFRYYNGSRP
jgi:hypothetical protein